METASKTGLGHQMKRDVKALIHCRAELLSALDTLSYITNKDVIRLREDIFKCMKKSDELASSAEEAYNQND